MWTVLSVFIYLIALFLTANADTFDEGSELTGVTASVRARRLRSVLADQEFNDWVDALDDDDIEYFYNLMLNDQMDDIMDAFRWDRIYDQYYGHYYGEYYGEYTDPSRGQGAIVANPPVNQQPPPVNQQPAVQAQGPINVIPPVNHNPAVQGPPVANDPVHHLAAPQNPQHLVQPNAPNAPGPNARNADRAAKAPKVLLRW